MRIVKFPGLIVMAVPMQITASMSVKSELRGLFDASNNVFYFRSNAGRILSVGE